MVYGIHFGDIDMKAVRQFAQCCLISNTSNIHREFYWIAGSAAREAFVNIRFNIHKERGAHLLAAIERAKGGSLNATLR